MDTKLRKASFSPITKTVAFLVVIICFGIAATMFVNLVRNTDGIEPLLEPNYVNTSELFSYQENFYIGLNNLLKFKNEEYIKQGNTIDKTEFENRKKDMFGELYNQMNQGYSEYNPNRMDVYNLLKEKFEVENAEKINQTYNSMIDNQLRSYYSLLQKVKSKEGLYFYATDGENTYTNAEQTDRGYFAGFKAYYLFDKDGIIVRPTSKENMNLSHTIEFTDSAIGNKIYIAVTDQYISKIQAEWNKQRVYLQNGITIILCAVCLSVIALLYLIWKAGRKEDDKSIHLMMIDRLYTDLNIAITFSVIFTWFAISIIFIREDYFVTDFGNIHTVFWLVVLFNAMFCSIGLALFLSLVRRFKNKTLIRHSIIYTSFAKLRKIIRTIFNLGSLSVRIAGIILVSEIMVFGLTILTFLTHSVFVLFWLILLCVLSVGGIYYVILKVKQFVDIAKGVQEIKNGKLEYVIDVTGNCDLSKLAGDINDIADGLKSAVAKELKAERMKSELVTNVSHDLKTPLTSIINYVDLLSKEKLIPDIANKYVEVLQQKSEKLKTLTQDLFEISKVQSGNILVEVEKIDIAVLLRQSLAEFDEQISSSGLDFKVNIKDDDTYIMADGKRLSRVFENLIGNILKYSLANTRVYIDVFVNESSVLIEFKNIANYEMNFREDEILERFVRGDKSRTTDGNGLGLAIAQSYVVVCGGSVQINIDGDLFKAIIKFNKA